MHWILLITTLLLPRHPRLSIMKSLLCRLAQHKNETATFKAYLIETLRLSYHLTRFLFSLIGKLKSKKTNHIIFCSNSVPDVRKKHIGHFAPIAENAEIDIGEAGNTIYYSGFKFAFFVNIIRLYMLFQFALFTTIFRKEKYSRKWIIDLFKNLIIGILRSTKQVNYYFFITYSEVNYITCLLLSSWRKNNCYFILSGTPIFKLQRYTWLPESNLILCSKYQTEEHKIYSAHKWMVSKTVQLWGLEEIDVYQKLKPSGPTLDIGYYSGAEWARNYYYWRIMDIDLLKNTKKFETFYYKVFETYLNVLVSLKKKNPELKIKVYPHPYERTLYNKHKISPPYLKTLEENDIYCHFDDETSIVTLYESKIGVGIAATVIFDRWHLNLQGFTYSGKGHEKEFIPGYNYKYLGKYEQLCFSNEKELETLITQNL